MHKKNIFSLILVMIFLSGLAQAQDLPPNVKKTMVPEYSKDIQQPSSIDYSKVTKDPKIIDALNLIDGTIGEWSKKAILGDNLSHKPIKIMFKNLSKISPSHQNFDAQGWIEKNGRISIYVNIKHKEAPPEAVACILCHEAIHQDQFSSIEEEAFGWTFEAAEWHQLKSKEPELSNPELNIYPLVQRMNRLEKMYIDGNYTNKLIRRSVSQNAGYKDLPEYSSGFGQ